MSMSLLLMGVITAARYSPDYTCLSFRNVTVQLNNQRVMRRSYPVSYPWEYAPDGQHVVYTERELSQVGAHFPVVIKDPAVLEGHWHAILQNTHTGDRLILQSPVNNFHTFWSPDSRQLAYTWESSDGKAYLALADVHGRERFKWQMAVIGLVWGDDYLAISYTGTQGIALKIIDTHTLEEVIFPRARLPIYLAQDQAVFVVNGKLTLYDLKQRQAVQSTLQVPASGLIGIYRSDAYIALKYLARSTQYFLKLFRVEADRLTFVADTPLQHLNNDWITQPLFKPYWVDAGLIYGSAGDQLELKRFDLNTLHETRIAVGIEDVAAEGENIVTARSVGTQTLLERVGADAPLLAVPDRIQFFVVQAQSGLALGNSTLYWYSLAGGESHAFDMTGRWFSIGENTLLIADARVTPVKLTLISLDNGQEILTFPVDLPDYGFEAMEPIPNSPDWLLRLLDETGVYFYRFSPPEKSLQRLAFFPDLSDNDVYQSVWSPDGKYYAFAYPVTGVHEFRIGVLSGNGQEQYMLGRFPDLASNLYHLNWSRCSY